MASASASTDEAQQALAIARDVDDPALLARTLTARGFIASVSYDFEVAQACFTEALGLARASDDRWRLSQILAHQAQAAYTAGDPIGLHAAAEEGRDLADAIGDRFNSRVCRFCLGAAQLFSGDLAGAATRFGEVTAEATAAHDEIWKVNSLSGQSLTLANLGEAAAARAAAEATRESGAELGGRSAALGHIVVGLAALAAEDGAVVREARKAARDDLIVVSGLTAATQRAWNAEAALADGDLAAARGWADEAVATTTGVLSALALTIRARVAIAQEEPDHGERDAHDALTRAAEFKAYLYIPDTLESLGTLAVDAGSHHEAARLFAAADSNRRRMGAVRFKIYDAANEASVAALRDAMGEKDFDAAWAEGAALSTEEAIAYAQRGRGQRKRPTSGWASLTPTELDVVRLVSEGLGNKDIAIRLFVSPRTVQTHLTHVYTKLGLTSRVQLVQEAARHN
jgi:DNA-binding CsgD family transcriptional regulator